MKTTQLLALVLPIAAAATACTHVDSGPQLKAAKQAYSTAANGPARAYAPDTLQLAGNSIGRAQRAHDWHDTQQRSFAMLAQSRAELADARGRTALAVQERDAAATRVAQLEAQKSERAVAECQAQQRGGVTAPQGANPLDALADRKENVRGGTRYIISSGIEFATNEATLTARARNKLDRVAQAVMVQPPNTSVEVEGFTDTTGGPHINNPLSERRAAAVAEYLKSRGVTDVKRTRGLGSSQPVGDNATKQGRMENRRAEVIVSPR
jgi:outer membrane protein OmpA-like peptidoglycan-associated protein